MRQLRLIWLSNYSASQRRVSSLPDGAGLPGVMASSECDRDSEGTIKYAQSEEMGSVVSNLSGMPDQEGSEVTHPVLGVAVNPAPVPVEKYKGNC